MYIRIVLAFWLVKLTKKQGGHMLTAKFGKSEADRSDWSGRPVRPVCLVLVRVGVVLFVQTLCNPTWRRGMTSPAYKYKG
jgi:hypothetical protein